MTSSDADSCPTDFSSRGPAARVGRALLALGVVGAVLGPVARAAETRESLRPPEPRPEAAGADPDNVLIETFETYAPGRLPPRGGWSSSYDPIFQVVTGGIRGRSAQHLSDGFGEFVIDALVSPTFGPTSGPVAVSLSRSEGAGWHQLVPVDLASELVLTRIELSPDGRLLVAQLGGQGVVFVDTGRTWAPDVPFRLGVRSDEVGQLEVFLDGESIFVGVDIVQATTGSPGKIDFLGFVANNFDEGTRLLVDDIGPDPESGPAPTVVEIPTLGPEGLGALAALLSFAAALELRRRRRRREVRAREDDRVSDPS